MIINKEIQITEPTAERVEIQNEWDTQELANVFEDKKRVMVRAKYAGCGKSYAACQMAKLGKKVLIVCPTNELIAQLKKDYKDIEGVTINRFFSFSGIENEHLKMSKFDDSDFDVIIFDEVYFYDVYMFQKIKRYCDNNDSKIIISAGDIFQLEPRNESGNNVDKSYRDNCLNIIFPHEVFLKENKRLMNEEDKQKLISIFEELFNEDIPVIDTIKKYFKFTDKIETVDNIAYQNTTCTFVAKQVRKCLNKTTDYEVGEKLTCKKRFQMKGIVFNVNYKYEIVNRRDKSLEIMDINTKETFNILIELIKENFIYSYCGTCHALQGSKKENPMTIFEWDFKHVTRNWIYTAITRATDLNNVYFYNGNLFQIKNHDNLIEKHFENKVKGYIKQDTKANRQIEDTYVNGEWLQSCIGQKCGRCQTGLYCEVDNGKIECNITAQRVDNSLCHNISNIIPYCEYCNVGQSNR
jgi:ATP-dependent exoDNAse (exonuclease V) alpha subunit